MHLLLVIMGPVFVGSSLRASPTSADVSYSLEKAPIFLPYTGARTSFGALRLKSMTPVVIYLHGCGGLHPYHDVLGWGQYVAEIGFLVVMPDSFARPSRRSNCDYQTKRTGAFVAAHEYRQQEINYTLEALRNTPFVDAAQIFLMGHSEGGVAVAVTRRSELRGLIITGWSCTCRAASCEVESGILSPRSIPALAIGFRSDPWFTPALQGRCIDWARGRKVTQVEIKGEGHEADNEPEAKEAVFRFLSSLTEGHKIVRPKKIEIQIESTDEDEPLEEMSLPATPGS